MAGLTGEQVMFLLQGVMLPMLEREHGITRRVIEAVPVDKGEYRPDAVSKTALELAWHIASAEHRFLGAVVAGQFDYNATRPETLRTSADVAAWYGEAFAKDLAGLKGLTAEQLLKPIDFRGLFTLPAIAYLQGGLNHSIHHRGQLSMYLRPMGAKVPAIYGESYDSAEAKKAARGKA